MINSKNKLTAFFSLVIVFCLSCFLIGPRVQYVQDGVKPINVYFKGPFGVSLDCDAPEFMDCANHLEYLLKDNSVRQSRPGIIFLANIVSLATKPLANRLMETIKPQAPTATSDYRYENKQSVS